MDGVITGSASLALSSLLLPFKMVYKIIKKTGRGILFPLFMSYPHPGLRVLYLLNLDLVFYTLPFFIGGNLIAFRKLVRLKLKGKRPRIIYFSTETDGRFDRFYQLSLSDPEIVVFKFYIFLANVENYYFESYAKRPIGFYEDARYRYIEQSNWQNRVNYRSFVHRMFDLLERFTGKIDLFLSGSNNDRYVVEMIHVSQERGTSWVVQEREGTGTDLTYKMEAIGFKETNCVVAHYHFLANDKHRECFEFAKTPTVRECKTLGELDSDFWFYFDAATVRAKYRSWDKYKKVVLFLTFGVRNYIEPTSFPNNPELSWKPLIVDCEEVLFKLATANPDVLFIYRMGHKEDLNAQFLARIEAAGLKNVIASTRSEPFMGIALRADVIVGFQTTAMFEAMFTDKCLIQVNWNIPKIVEPVTNLLPISKYGACLVANSRQQFEELVSDCLAKSEQFKPDSMMMSARKKTREIMFHDADGRVAERFMVEIKRLLKLRESA